MKITPFTPTVWLGLAALTGGLAMIAGPLGDAHVDAAEAGKTAFDAPFQALITEAAWGTVWAGPHWTLRERSMVTIALMAALGHDEELAMHIRAARNNGCTKAEIRDVFLQCAVYAGVPVMRDAVRVAQEVFAEERKPARR